MGAQNPWARRRKVSLGDLASEPWIHMHLRTQLVANSGFITIMPNSMFQFNAKRWGLKALPIDLGIKRRNVSIVTLKHRTLNSVVQVFVEHVRFVSRQLRETR